MEILIRQTSDIDDPDAVFTDVSLDVKILRIGSAVDQELQLIGSDILPAHAELFKTRKGSKIKCRRGAVVTLNGVEGRQFDLSIGDIIELDGNRIEVAAGADGFDIGLIVSKRSSSLPTRYEQAYKTDLTQTRLSPRAFGWALTLCVLVVAMVLPLAYHYLSKSDSTLLADNSTWPVTDTIWTSGPLHETHASLGESCNSCHVNLFEKVSNESCNACHSDTNDHVMALAANQHVPVEMNGTCAGCHREHNEPVSSLINTGNKLCVDCHGGHELHSEEYALENITGFGVDLHAPFQVSLLKPPDGGSYDTSDEWVISREPLEQARENSQLKFNHEVHYDSSKVKSSGDEQLACGDCHELNVDGEHFKSIEFEQNCTNSGCHDLDLDPRNQMPHGLPGITVAAIEGFYLRKFGNPDIADVTPVRERRRLLDRESDEDERCDGSAYECALELAASKIEQQFTTTGCVTCHSIDDVGGEVVDRYQVAVVKLNEDYLPNARFDHMAHGVLVEPGSANSYTGDESCVYCHAAPDSSSSHDVLIPAIENCTTCHNGPERTLNVPLGCIDCHAYHLAL